MLQRKGSILEYDVFHTPCVFFCKPGSSQKQVCFSEHHLTRFSFYFITVCEHKGTTYNDTQKFDDECNICVCKNGTVKCTQKKCEAEQEKGL